MVSLVIWVKCTQVCSALKLRKPPCSAVEKHHNQDYLQPTSVRKLREFICMVIFYRRLIPNYADTLHALTDLLTRHGKEPKRRLVWSNECAAAFTTVKSSLVEATMLAQPILSQMHHYVSRWMHQMWQLVEYFNSMWKGSGNPFPSFPKGCSQQRQGTAPLVTSCWQFISQSAIFVMRLMVGGLCLH